MSRKKAKDSKLKTITTKSGNDSSSISHTKAQLVSPEKTDVNTSKIRVPVSVEVETEKVKELDNGLTLVKGYVNGKEAWILRDTGYTTVCISKKFADQIDVSNQEEKWVSLANRSECSCYEVEVSLESPYISGNVIALTMKCPFADVILGETVLVKTLNTSKNKYAKYICKRECRPFSYWEAR